MRKSGKGYRKLLAFQAAHDLVKFTYRITVTFPKAEQFGLTSQMRRASVSVAANIVEGHALNTTTQFLRHLYISFASCKELEYFFELSEELGYMEHTEAENASQLEGRAAYLIGSLLRSLRDKKERAVAEIAAPIGSSLDSLDSLDSI